MRGVGKALVVAAALATSPANSGDLLIPSAKAVLYPGDVITEDALVDVPFDGPAPSGPIALSHDQLVGKAARRTLLPGKAIPLAAIDNPRVVRSGAEVTMVYKDGALTITAVGAALQEGAIGDLIKVRNVDSGVTVQGRIQANGTVLVSG